ncbi:hypothetical protein ZWY2020_023036 [Hordeum vulgare]|nr:hypothetical protein ZWY2020_023036 [Hordeum vulgare]
MKQRGCDGFDLPFQQFAREIACTVFPSPCRWCSLRSAEERRGIWDLPSAERTRWCDHERHRESLVELNVNVMLSRMAARQEKSSRRTSLRHPRSSVFSATRVVAVGAPVPVTTLGVLLMDRSGRKPLLLVSTSGLLVRTLMSAVSFYLKIHGIFPEQAPIVALTSILIFPINMKGIGGSFVTLVNWLTSLAVSFAFNFLMSWSSSGTFFFFAFDCAMAILFIVKIVPETKGKALEEIQGSINWDT